ncbi:MAG: Dam family site-specific DNA-(adenine-N6)-methyltransferase [Chloroflexota bacterium]
MKVQNQAARLVPPLKWAGGKRWLLPQLKKLWTSNEDRRLIELFCGGLAATLGLVPEKALLNDINPHLVNFYRQLQKGLPITISMENNADDYYSQRTRFNEMIREGQSQSIEAAQIFYYLNRTCYNGLCRFNHSGEFNVPFGKYKTINYTRDFSSYKEPLSAWQFQLGSFEDVILTPLDFVYADPPYDVEFVSYSKEGFSWEQQVKLAEWLVEHPGPVVLSNQATDRIVALYKKLGFQLVFLMSPRRISCTGDRTPALEVLAIRGMDIDIEALQGAAPDRATPIPFL